MNAALLAAPFNLVRGPGQIYSQTRTNIGYPFGGNAAVSQPSATGMQGFGRTQPWSVSPMVQFPGTLPEMPNPADSTQWALDHIARQEAGPVIGLVAQQLPFESAMPGGPFNQMLPEGVNGYLPPSGFHVSSEDADDTLRARVSDGTDTANQPLFAAFGPPLDCDWLITTAALQQALAALETAEDAAAWAIHDYIVLLSILCPEVAMHALGQFRETTHRELAAGIKTRSEGHRMVSLLLDTSIPCARGLYMLDEIVRTSTDPLFEVLKGERLNRLLAALDLLSTGNCIFPDIATIPLIQQEAVAKLRINIKDLERVRKAARSANKERRRVR